MLSGAGLKLVESDEYSESGRGVYPDGLYRMLLQFHERYKQLDIPFIITENGVSDRTDLIRRPYILEHLLAVYAAMIMVSTRKLNTNPCENEFVVSMQLYVDKIYCYL